MSLFNPALKREKNRLTRIAAFPDSLSLENIDDLANRLSHLYSDLNPEAAAKLEKYLDFITAFVKVSMDQCVERNINLVGAVIQNKFFVRLKSKGLDLDDAAQEGAIGLMTAAFLFDPLRGYTFSTYAIWWIQCFIRRLLTKANLIHIPSYLSNAAMDPDIPKYNKRLQEAEQAKKIHSINSSNGGINANSKSKDIPDRQDDWLSFVDNRIDIMDMLKYLHPVEKRIIELRYLYGYSLDETAKALYREGITPKVTKERIRQRESRAIRTIKEKIYSISKVRREESNEA